ncbi:cyclic nucleotide-binding/CBS domain-containing protein [Halobacteriovorax sp. HLS]|uniref:CBS domain-containing protein n=1 Tax=Halobacteriovorax sp. HLS TaxID=2234000 RepID=UPI000FDB9D54|nr:CBS domain-containing protein [Halobacteriovorax sp. HLS]
MLESEQRDYTVVSADDFSVPVKELDLADATFVPGDCSIEKALESLNSSQAGALLIGTSSKLEGIITEKDMLHKAVLNFELVKDNPVSSIMTANPLTLSEDNTVLDIIKLMCAKEFRHLPIKKSDGHAMIGVNDLLYYFLDHFHSDLEVHGTKIEWSRDGVYLQEFIHYNEEDESLEEEISPRIFETPLRKIMFRDAHYCDAETPFYEAVKSMVEKRKGSILVMEYETEMRGIVSERDLIRKFLTFDDLKLVAIREFMTKDPHKLLEQDLIAVALNNMSKFKYRSVIVANQEGFPISIVTILDILKYIASKF